MQNNNDNNKEFPKEFPLDIQNIKRWLYGKACEQQEDEHDLLSAQIYRRLSIRHSLLNEVEKLSRTHEVHDELQKIYEKNTSRVANSLSTGNAVEKKIENSDEKSEALKSQTNTVRCGSLAEAACSIGEIPPALRAYRLAVTDLFVEKALAYLESHAAGYKTKGQRAYVASFIVIAFGMCLSVYAMLMQQGTYSHSWLELLSSFMRGFTAYGMIVLTAVALWRYGKAMLDQAERLLERRHALRQGRLFVHLNKGQLSISEMENAFNWNVSQNNAFGNMATDSQAPLGALAKDLSRVAP